MAQILAFGDSITDGAYDEQCGWAARMQRSIMAANLKKDTVREETDWFYNLGISGNTAQDVLLRIDTEAKARKVFREDTRSIILFAIGTNDSAAYGRADNFLCTGEEFRKNLHMLASKTQSDQTRIMFIGLMPVIERLTTPIYDDVWYTNDRISSFNDVIREVAYDLSATFIDLKKDDESNNEAYFIDGLHPNSQGHEWMFKKIKPVVEEEVASL